MDTAMAVRARVILEECNMKTKSLTMRHTAEDSEAVLTSVSAPIHANSGCPKVDTRSLFSSATFGTNAQVK